MWEVFRLNLITVKNYAGEHLLFILVAAAFIYLLISEKDKKNRALFVYLPAAILMISMFPHVRMLFARFIDEGDTYYRVLWLIPSGAVLSFAAERVFRKKKIAGLIIMAAAVMAAGSSMYGSKAREQNMISASENPYHLPEEAVQTARIILEGEEGHQLKAAVPPELTLYLRQYDTNIYLAYGREVLMGYPMENDIFMALNVSPTDMASLKEAGRAKQVSFYVVYKDQEFKVRPEEAGLNCRGETERFSVWCDEEELEEMRAINFYYR